MPVKEQQLVIPHPRALPNLSLIGVPDGAQGRSPSESSYPGKFEPHARFVWEKMFKDENFTSRIKQLSVDDKWYQSIVEFLQRCEAIGALPFFPVTEQQRNDSVMESLTHARVALVKFFDGIGMFERVKIYKACREYKPKEWGFGIVSYAYCRPISDPTFEKWLTTAPTPRFLRSLDLKFKKLILPNCEAWVRVPNLSRITVGFEIQVASPVSVQGNRLATKKEINNFVDRTIWLPIVRAHRFEGIGLRLF